MRDKIVFLMLIFFILSGVNSIAQVQLSGSVENQMSIRLSDSLDLMKLTQFVNLKIRSSIGDNSSLYGELGLIHAFGNNDMPGVLMEYGETENYIGVNLKEIYMDLALGIFDFRLGNQIVSWGQVDAFAPTDNINPMDYRGFDILNFSNMKIAIPMVKVDAYLFNYYLHIEGIYIPYFFESVYPGQNSEWSFYRPSTPETMDIGGSLYAVDSVVQNPVEYPVKSLESFEAGLRVASSVLGFDFSGSYFYTWDDNPTVHQDIAIDSPALGEVTITVTPKYHRLHIVGLDLAKAIGPLGLRMESALFITDIDDPYMKWAIGADISLFNSININLQFSQVITEINFNSSGQVETHNSIILGLIGSFLEERLSVEAGAIYQFEDKDYLILAKAGYDFSDALSLTVGVNIFGGDADTQFGNYDGNDAIFMNAKYSF